MAFFLPTHHRKVTPGLSPFDTNASLEVAKLGFWDVRDQFLSYELDGSFKAYTKLC
jgi:hypothetical protein